MTTTPAIPSSDPSRWPKSYLLRLYADAVAHGAIRISPLSETSARSLAAAFYRLRRRKDTKLATYILPEYHLVTMTGWQPGFGGCVHIIFNKLPEGETLPEITPISPEEAAPPPPPSIEENTASLIEAIEEINPEDFVRSLRKEANPDA